ncbi:MAG: hypothetical protein C0399_12330 [Syntrophus sp. (in: bacteria)]|nr:hypothetical protein [Syntrophus sp. (in: bacteria)]
MAIRGLSNEEHRNVLAELVRFAERAEVNRIHSAGLEYTSLMVCFLTHSVRAADSLLRLIQSFGEEYFPTTVGYTIVRPMFEIDVTSHYITQDPSTRSRQYVEYESILTKKQMDAWGKHRGSKKPDWREAMETAWQSGWAPRQTQVEARYNSVRTKFENPAKRGQVVHNWSGKSLRKMAVEVDHEEAYDIFYADLSSFTHADVRLANRFLRLDSTGMSWSSRASYPDVGGVFRYADIFLSCFLGLFGPAFGLWSEEEVRECWG